jgi:phosphotransferase system enzyme I (PtsI)
VGRPVSPGIAHGEAFLKRDILQRVTVRKIPEGEVELELQRFQDALRRSRDELAQLRERARAEVGERDARILDAHLACLTDPLFVSQVEKAVRKDLLNLDGAVSKTVSDFGRIFELVQNQDLKERAADLRDVGIRILRNLDHRTGDGRRLPDRYVLVAPELGPQDLFGLETSGLQAIVAERGGPSSHAAILARSKGIPMVQGSPPKGIQVQEGDVVLVDGTTGSVFVNPGEKVLSEYRALEEAYRAARERDREALRSEPRTRDGTAIILMANLDRAFELEAVQALGLAGVGLFRPEYDQAQGGAGGDEAQAELYGRAVALLEGRPFVVRLLEPAAEPEALREANPALGRRSLRALLERPELLRTQLRALLRAAARGPVQVLVPFATRVEDVLRVRELLREEQARLQHAGHARPRIELGVMVEVPALALTINDVLPEVDFVQVGLDNLVQYLTAADREGGPAQDWYDPCHPAVLRTVADLAAAGAAADRPVTACGEMAGDPMFLPFFLGLGILRVSVSLFSIGPIKQALPLIDLAEARALSRRLLTLRRRADVRKALEAFRERMSPEESVKGTGAAGPASP